MKEHSTLMADSNLEVMHPFIRCECDTNVFLISDSNPSVMLGFVIFFAFFPLSTQLLANVKDKILSVLN